MTNHSETALEHTDNLSQQLRIPCEMISLHRDLSTATLPDGGSLRGRRQHTLRWGAFLLIYGALEGYYESLLGYRAIKNRTLSLDPTRVQQFANETHGVTLFNNSWACRTRVRPASGTNHSEWHTFSGVRAINTYLGDLKSLRDLLSHGGDPYAARNLSGALWTIKRGESMRIMGVEGFLQAACDLADHTAIAFGVGLAELPDWPRPTRSELSALPLPELSSLPGR
ncbi:hypothetical protein [Microbacterium oxydans]|uniref:hypothetical protein n=1 Tax=Microbacterium oxydans TaxID=82380 RepID=UPI003672BF57